MTTDIFVFVCAENKESIKPVDNVESGLPLGASLISSYQSCLKTFENDTQNEINDLDKLNYIEKGSALF